MKRALGAVLAGALLAGLVTFGRSRSSRPLRAPNGAAASGTRATPVRGPWRVGDVHKYDLELDTQMQAGGATVADYRLTGTWVVDVLEVSTARVLLRARIDDAALDVRGQALNAAIKANLKQASTQFSTALFYTLDSRGALSDVRDSDQVELQVRSMQRAVAAVSQVVLQNDAESWEVSERDNVGDYLAHYQRVGKNSLRKNKLRYTRLNPQAAAAGNGGAGVDIAASEATLQLRDDQFLLELNASETAQATGSALGGVKTTSRYRLAYAGSSRLADDLVASAAAQAPKTASAPNEYARSGQYSVEADRARIAGRSFTDMMSELKGLPPGPDQYSAADSKRKRLAFIGLAALFRREPEAVASARAVIESGSNWASFLWDALGSSGSPQAQAALRTLIAQPRWNEDQRLSQMIDLSMATAPTSETVQFFRDHLDDPEQSAQARMGLGTTAFNLKDTDPAQARAIAQELVERLSTARDGRERIDFLQALGNTGLPEALPAITAQLSSDEARVRAAAVSGLLHIQDDHANDLLAHVLQQDNDESVRRAAATTAGSRRLTENLAQALASAWKTDPDQGVRSTAEAAIQRLDRSYPGLMAHMR